MGEEDRALPNGIEHGDGELAGEGVLLAGVVGAQQGNALRKGVLGAMGEMEGFDGQVVQAQDVLEGDAAEGNKDRWFYKVELLF